MNFRLSVIGKTPWHLAALATSLVLWMQPGLAAEDAPGRTVEELLVYAREHNPDLRVRRLNAQALRERVESASALPDPRFQLELMDFTNAMTPKKSASLLPGEVGTTRYRIIQGLPFPGKRSLRGEVAEALASQADTSHDAARLDLETKIKVAYARHFQAVGQKRILSETLHLVDALERLVVRRYSVGLVPQQDAVRVQSESTSLKVDLVESERRRQEAAAKLNALLPRAADAPLAEPMRLMAPPSGRSLAQIYAQAREISPDLSLERLGVNAAEKAKDLVYLNRYPDFSLALTNNRPRSNMIGPETWDLMVEVNIPLQQSSRRAQEREARYRLDAARERVAAAEARLNGRLGETLAGFNASLEKARLLRDTLLPQARATLDSAQAGYESGRVNFNALIEAERQILRTRLALLDAEVEASVRQAELEQLAGAPL